MGALPPPRFARLPRRIWDKMKYNLTQNFGFTFFQIHMPNVELRGAA